MNLRTSMLYQLVDNIGDADGLPGWRAPCVFVSRGPHLERSQPAFRFLLGSREPVQGIASALVQGLRIYYGAERSGHRGSSGAAVTGLLQRRTRK